MAVAAERLLADLESLAREARQSLDRGDLSASAEALVRTGPLVAAICRRQAQFSAEDRKRIHAIQVTLTEVGDALQPMRQQLAEDRGALQGRRRQVRGVRQTYLRRPAAAQASETVFEA
jgi:hypothetical protein